MEKLKIGQLLWRLKEDNSIYYSVKVIEVFDEYFTAEYHDEQDRIQKTFKYSFLGKKLFTEAQLSELKKVQTDLTESNISDVVSIPQCGVVECGKCALRKNGECSSLQSIPCDDYRPCQEIPQCEIDAWPKYGDANGIKMNDRGRYKRY